MDWWSAGCCVDKKVLINQLDAFVVNPNKLCNIAVKIIFKVIDAKERNVSKYRFLDTFFKKTRFTKIKNRKDKKTFGNRKGEEIANPKKIKNIVLGTSFSTV